MLILYYCNGSVFIYVYNYIQYILRGRERERERERIYVQIFRTIIISMYRYHAGMDPAK